MEAAPSHSKKLQRWAKFKDPLAELPSTRTDMQNIQTCDMSYGFIQMVHVVVRSMNLMVTRTVEGKEFVMGWNRISKTWRY